MEEILRRANAVHPISLVEVRYSLADRHIEDDLLPTARELGVGIVAFGVLLSGLIGGSSQEEKLKSIGQRISPEALATMKANLVRTDALKQIAVEKGATLAQLAIAWVLAQGEDIIALVGSRTASQIKDTIQDIECETNERGFGQNKTDYAKRRGNLFIHVGCGYRFQRTIPCQTVALLSEETWMKVPRRPPNGGSNEHLSLPPSPGE